MSLQYKALLKNHLLSSPDDFYMLQAATGAEPEPSRLDRVLLSAPLPDDITEEYITSVMSWPDRKRLYMFIKNVTDISGVTKEVIHPVLIEYFVLQKRTVPFEVKE